MENAFEHHPSEQERGEGARRLHELEQTGRYVFHGSQTSDLSELEPRQGQDFDEALGKMMPDGDPAVSASQYADIAIFRALARGGSTQFGATEEGILNFGATDEVISAMRTAKGYVYVFPRDHFAPRPKEQSHHEWRSHGIVKPAYVIPVQGEDLPPGIERIKSGFEEEP